MAKITFDKQHNVDVPTLLLQNRNFDTLGKINDVFSLEYKENFNSANELSFTVYKSINGNENTLWDLILNNKIIFIPEFEERFVITVSVNDDSAVSKSVTGISLCESELSQINLYNIEINTETDILGNSDYVATTFYNEEYRERSLLHRLFEKAPHYSIAYVQDSLKDIKDPKSFSISDTDLYSELSGEIAQEFNCIFIFNSMDRTVSVYDLYNTCDSASCNHFRGDFSDKCPECDSESFGGQYGDDTTVFISGENLATQINLEPDMDSYKNCFYVEGGDDVINAALCSINPNGTNYIYYFSDDILNDMPNSLIDILKEYNKLYNEHNSIMEYNFMDYDFDAAIYVSDYNEVVSDVKDKFKDDENIQKRFKTIPDNGVLAGYPATTTVMYEAIDLYSFLKSSMMPTINTEGEGLEASLENIVNGFVNGFTGKDGTVTFNNEIAIRNNTSATRKSVERVIEKAAKLFFNTAYYNLEINTGTYAQADSETSNGMWIGSFKLTSLTENDENGNKKSCESEQIVLSVSSNAELFTQQEICRAVTDSKKFKEKYKNVLSLKTDDEDFLKQIGYYAHDELYNLSDIFTSCKEVLIQTKEESDMDDSLFDKYSDFFNERMKHIDKEIEKRDTQLKCVLKIYDCQNNSDDGILNKIRRKVNNELNIEKFIKKWHDGTHLWKTFCSYRREDKYSNSNYISDGLTDSEIVEKAEELLNVAKKELYKAGNIQYSISSTMNNLLALKEFYPLKDKFSVGNWIRVGINERVYKLRLISYKVNFDEIDSIDVEFSTVEKIYNGYSDVESVIKSASSIAGSYSGLVQQMTKTASTANKINNLVSDGLNATRTKFVDSDNEEIVIDSHGILGRRYDYVTDSYEKHQIKFLSNGLYTTSDNWKTIDTGIGRISYTDPETHEEINDYGIIAKTIIGKLFIGEELKIYGKNNSIILDDDGITLDGGAIRWKRKIPKKEVEGLEKELSEFVESLGDLQKQIDGEITSWFDNHIPTNDNIPASEWTTEEEKVKHEGDLFYNTETGRAYRYIYDKTSKEHKWYIVTDEAITKALANAQKAQDTADGKRRTFINEPYPPYDEGDLWTQGDDGDLMVCINAKEVGQFDENDWIKAVKYTDDRAWEAWCSDTGEFGKYKKEIETQIDGKSDCTYGGSEPPINAESGDLWFCTQNSDDYKENKAYMYDGSEWKEANGVPDSVWDIADGKSSIFVEKPCKPLSLIEDHEDYHWYYKSDIWILEKDYTLNGKLYKKGSILTANSNSTSVKNGTNFKDTDWVEKLRYTDDSELIQYKQETDAFCDKINSSLFTSTDNITDKYVISPRIGGGYLYISKDGCGSVTIDPYQSKITGYIFAVKNSDDNVVMGVDTSGNAVFSGELNAATGTFMGDVKTGYTTNGEPKSPYNCIIDSDGLRVGVGNGGMTYSFIVESNGNVTTKGNLNLCNSLLYNQKNGLGLNNNLTIFNGGKFVFRGETWDSGITNEQGSYGYISPMTGSGSPGISLSGMNLDISASRTLTLYSGITPVIIESGFGLDLSHTFTDNEGIEKTVSCNINVNNNGQCVIKNSVGTSVAVMNGSLSVPSKDDGITDLGRSNAKWKDVYSSTALISTSDRNYKKEITPLNQKYEEFFMKLLPVSFMFKDGNSGRTHIGFISQDVETAMFECGLTDLDFAGFCKDIKKESYFDENGNESFKDVLNEDGNPVYIYSLRYEEFVPLNTHMLQKCINKINDLENKIMHLQDGNS